MMALIAAGVAFGIFAALMLGALFVYRLRYPERTRAFVVCVDPIVQNGEKFWAAWIDEGPVFMSRDEDRAVAYALEWQVERMTEVRQ